MSEKDKPRWVEMTHQTFARDALKGKPGERTFVETSTNSALVFRKFAPAGALAFKIEGPNMATPYRNVYTRRDLKEALRNLELPKFRRGRGFLNSF